jgi:hypothetical protein
VQRLLDPRYVAVLLGGAILVLAILGAFFAWDPRPGLEPFDLDEERTVPAYFSAALLAACAPLALRLPRAVLSRPAAVVFAALLLLASLDELVEIHERLERRLDTDWQLLYTPVFIAIAVVFVLFLLGLRRNGLDVGLGLTLASAACWGAAQLLEFLQWEDEGPAPGYTWMMVAEETLEMTGSALLLIALLVVRGQGAEGPP